MKIKVESCFNGHYVFQRLSWKDHYICIRDEKWSRKTAIEALNILENVYGLQRKTIRFVYK